MSSPEPETKRERRARERVERTTRQAQEKGRQILLRAALGGTLALIVAAGGTAIALNRQPTPSTSPTPITIPDNRPTPETSATTSLNLTINQRDWEQALRIGPQWGNLTEAPSRERLDCFPTLGGLCMGKFSPNFLVGLNKPVSDLMVKETGAINPVRPIKMIFVEDWLQAEDGEYVLGGVRRTGNETDVAISLKAVAWNTFSIMAAAGTLSDPNADEYFAGTASIVASRAAAHELAHAGKEARLLAPLSNPGPVAELTHPQIYAFEERYGNLISEAAQRGRAEASLFVNVEPRRGINLLAYRDQVNLEAQQIGIAHPVPTG